MTCVVDINIFEDLQLTLFDIYAKKNTKKLS